MPNFDRTTIPDLTGRVILVTGGTAGVGAETVVELSKHNPAHILFTGRSAPSASTTIDRARAAAPHNPLTFIPCDLASLTSVRAAASTILDSCTRLDLFLANAGIMAKPPGLSEDGYEVHFATNHVGHALLTRKLLPLLERTAEEVPGADVRVVFTSSTAWVMGGIPFEKLRGEQEGWFLGSWVRYGNSKLANVVYAREVARRYPKVLCFSVTPGVVGTGLVTGLGWVHKAFVYVSQMGRVMTVEEGCGNHLWAVSAPRGEIEAGKFYEPVGVLSSKETKQSRDPELGGKLWEWTERELEGWM